MAKKATPTTRPVDELGIPGITGALIERLCNAVEAGKEVKGLLPQRIERNEAFYDNRIVSLGPKPWPSAQEFHIPLTQPRLDQRKAKLVGTLTANDRLFQLKKVTDQEVVEEAEQGLQFALDMCSFDEHLDTICQMVMVTNAAIVRATFEERADYYEDAPFLGDYHGLVVDVIHPDNFVCWPANQQGTHKARLVGHVFEMRMGEVLAKIDLGLENGGWIKDATVVPSNAPLYDDATGIMNLNAVSSDRMDETVHIWDVLYRAEEADGSKKWTRYLIQLESRSLLLKEDYDIPIPYYIDFQIKKEPNVFWTQGSAAQDMQGLQIMINALVNQFFWGTQMASRPSVMTEGWQFDESMVGTEPGQFINVKNIGKTMPVPSLFDPKGFDFLLSFVRQMADGTSRTSDAITGAPSAKRDSTATEENIKFQGFQLAGSDDVKKVRNGMRRLAMLVLWYLSQGTNFAGFKKTFGKSVVAESADVFKGPYVIELTGQTPEDTPQVQGEQAKMLLEVAKAFPDGGIPVSMILKTIVLSTNMPNRDDIVRMIDEHEAQLGQMQNMQQLLQMMMGLKGQMGGMNGNQQPGNPGDLSPLMELPGMGGGQGVPEGGGDSDLGALIEQVIASGNAGGH